MILCIVFCRCLIVGYCFGSFVKIRELWKSEWWFIAKVACTVWSSVGNRVIMNGSTGDFSTLM